MLSFFPNGKDRFDNGAKVGQLLGSGQKQRAKAGAKARVNALPCDLFELRLDCCNDPGRERLGLRRK